MIDYQSLNGTQRVVLADTIRKALARKSRFDDVMDAADLPYLDDLVPSDGFEYQLPRYIGESQRRGELEAVMKALLGSTFAAGPELQLLEDRIALARPVMPTEDAPALQLERLVVNSGFEDTFDWTDRLLKHARAICRITYPTARGTLKGTGLALSPHQVLTNYHVIKPILDGHAAAGDVTLSFGYAEVDGKIQVGTQAALAKDWIAGHAPYAPFDEGKSTDPPAADALDYAVLNLRDPIEGVAMDKPKDPPPQIALNDIVLVLQHPKGAPLKLSMGVINDLPVPNRMRYTASTLGGSSGALVLNAGLEPIGLHHAGDPDFEALATYNQGIPLALILAALKD